MNDEEIKNPIKNILYRVMSQRKDHTRSAEDISNAISLWWNNEPVEKNYTGGGATTEEELWDLGYDNYNNPNRDFNKLYLTGDDSGFTQLPDDSRGFTYKDYTLKNNYDPNTYEGHLLQDDEIVLPAKYESAIKSLLGLHTFVNNLNTGLDDVAHHIQKIGQDENGNLEIQASDIWDFNSGDWNSLWKKALDNKQKRDMTGTINDLINKVGHKVLDASGKPFILRDYAKIKFSNDVTDEEIPWSMRTWVNLLPSYEGMEDGMPHFLLPEMELYNDPNKLQKIQEWYTEKQKQGGQINYLNLFLDGGAVSAAWDIGKRFIPIVSTYYDILDAINNPTAKNIGLAAASVGGDVLTLFGVGAGVKAGVRAAKAADKVNDAIRTFDKAHDAASQAKQTYIAANQAANKASQKVTSTTLAGGNNAQIIQAQQKANAANQMALEAANNYKIAQLALDGTVPTVKNVTHTTPGGASLTTKTLSTSYPSAYKYGDDATSALEKAQAILYNAEKAVPTTAEKIVWPLGGVGIHGGITGMRGNTLTK